MTSIKNVDNVETLDKIFDDTLAVVFKHSTRCPISLGVKTEIEEFAKSFSGEGNIYFIDIIANRDVSGKIEEKTGVVHQSPQVIILHKGKVAWHESHWNITEKALIKATTR